ncbi:MAG TPA: cupin domain-containing protein [Vicinamibacterales bacterium]|nr:cupin domain-containing protein [Vicinamibacterales bacterium]
MRKSVAFVVVLLSLLASTGASTPHAQPLGARRTVLLRRPINVPGYEEVMVETEIPVGGREGRHTHPGTMFARVEQGRVLIDCEGKQSALYNVGDSYFVDADDVHEGINTGDVPTKILVTLVVKTGESLTVQVK